MNKAIFAFFTVFSLIFILSCIQEAEEEFPPVRYTVIVQDSLTGDPVASAEVSITTSDLEEDLYTTNSNGKAILAPVSSRTNQFIISADDYRTFDTVDYVVETQDTAAEYNLRVLNIKLIPDSLDLRDTLMSYVRYSINISERVSGTPLSSALVTINAQGGVVDSARSDSQGKAVFDRIPYGSNQISVQKSGFVSRDTVDVAYQPYAGHVEFRVIDMALDSLGN